MIIDTLLAAVRRLLVLAIAAGALAGPALADDDDDIDRMRDAVARGDILSLADLRVIIRDRWPGEIVNIDADEDDGRITYAFKVLQASGRLLEIEMDAKTGAVLEVDND